MELTSGVPGQLVAPGPRFCCIVIAAKAVVTALAITAPIKSMGNKVFIGVLFWGFVEAENRWR
jgi:hypothetical protein